MLRLREIMTTDVMAMSPETTLREAMELLARRHVSGAPVLTDRGELVGIVTAMDLIAFAATLAGVPTERDSQEEWGEFAEPTIEDEIDEEATPGGAYFSQLWDDAGADVSERMDSVSGPEWNVLEEHTVSEVMTRTPVAMLPPTAPVEAAADLMRTQGIHRVLVVDDARLVGIVSTLDVVRAAADRRLTARTFVFGRAE